MKEKFQFKSIRSRLTFWFAVIAILPFIVAGVIIYNQMVDSRKTSKFQNLQTIRDLKVGEVNNWLDQRIGDVRTIASDHEIRMLKRVYEKEREYTQENIKIITTVRDILNRYLQNYKTTMTFIKFTLSVYTPNGYLYLLMKGTREKAVQRTPVLLNQ